MNRHLILWCVVAGLPLTQGLLLRAAQPPIATNPQPRLEPAVKPGKPEESLLISAVRHDGELKMPFREKLSARQIADLTAWVQMGAPWPESQAAVRPAPPKNGPIFTRAERSFWAFQKPLAAPLPAVRHAAWPQSPIDHYILAKLEEHGLRPAAAADRRTLLRRATFDLTGLPPTPQEVAAFLADQSPNAFARVVDRLLASPAYGERWGRHWLDVARYADSNGMDENLAYANAFRYRDYVVGAFNHDLPYDRFVQEQLAGDLLPAATDEARRRQDIATGFLALGPKMLAEDDPAKMEMDIVDEQIDTVGRTFLGLTLGCARCHDHKFDPIPMADYYALAGIFKSTRTMDTFTVVARWYERPIAKSADQERLRAHQARVEQKRKAIAALPNNSPALKQLQAELAALEKAKPALSEAMGVTEGKIANVRIHLRGSHWTLGPEVPRRFPRVLAGEDQPPIDARLSGRRQLAEWLTRPNHPLTARVMVNRLWTWHFGVGLVRSTDNFGRLGDRPVHQPLLDWLAVRLVQSGWSLKAVHRLILLSSTYQMSTAFDEQAARVDPENRLHWRMNRRRLEAEALRDALLILGGQLDRTMGGSLFQGGNRQYVPGYPNTTYDRYDFPRRSIYLPVIRSDLYPVFQAFDFADPSTSRGRRAVTTVAPQALFMMNGKLVLDQTRRLAQGLLVEPTLDDAGRVHRLYEQAYSRPPTTGETARALEFVRCVEVTFGQTANPTERRQRAWQSLCKVIVAANEFVYVE
jgi:hypothetical protein